jgi:ferredoxin/coenzyme F420-reducing hydrogenase delta subunit
MEAALSSMAGEGGGHGVLRTLRAADESLTQRFDAAFAPASNPWRHLGSLAVFCLVVAIATGTVAYAIFDTSVIGAYDSGRSLDSDPFLPGRLLRGFHRYAADAFMLLTLLHVLREGMRGHFVGARWFSWLTGIPLVWLLWGAGLTGLWLAWDERALYSVTATAEWFQALPLTGELLARNFITSDAMNDRFFSLVMFIHIGVPLLLLACLWIHVQRLAHVRIWPPRALVLGSLAMLAALALCAPAQSLGRADIGHVPATLSLDWFYQFAHPLADALTAQGAWLLAAAVTLLAGLMPALPLRPRDKSGAAQVNLQNCNGCARCAADCPFGAVTMVPRSDGRPHARQASVTAELCVACGICVGACPSSTPFRSLRDLVSGIELPDRPMADLRDHLQATLGESTGQQKLVVFACRQARGFAGLADHSTAVVPIECAAMVPPSFLEYALRLGAHGVVIAGCLESDCEFRLGDRWVAGRMSGTREPRLRAAAPRERIVTAWAGNDPAKICRTLASLRASLRAQALLRATQPGTTQRGPS